MANNLNFDKILKDDYGNAPKKVLEKYDYDYGEKIFEKIKKKNWKSENKNIINEIVLWKIERQILGDEEKLLNLCTRIKKIESVDEALTNSEQKIKVIIKELLEFKEIQLAMASTIMHFYNPNVFPIFDQRAYRVIFEKDYKKIYSKTKLANTYIDYLKTCKEYYDNKINGKIYFSDLDKYLYQLDILAGNHVSNY